MSGFRSDFAGVGASLSPGASRCLHVLLNFACRAPPERPLPRRLRTRFVPPLFPTFWPAVRINAAAPRTCAFSFIQASSCLPLGRRSLFFAFSTVRHQFPPFFLSFSLHVCVSHPPTAVFLLRLSGLIPFPPSLDSHFFHTHSRWPSARFYAGFAPFVALLLAFGLLSACLSPSSRSCAAALRTLPAVVDFFLFPVSAYFLRNRLLCFAWSRPRDVDGRGFPPARPRGFLQLASGPFCLPFKGLFHPREGFPRLLAPLLPLTASAESPLPLSPCHFAPLVPWLQPAPLDPSWALAGCPHLAVPASRPVGHATLPPLLSFQRHSLGTLVLFHRAPTRLLTPRASCFCLAFPAFLRR